MTEPLTIDSKPMHNAVFISSAIFTKHGVISTLDRIKQTIETVTSVKNKIANPRIAVIDNSDAAIMGTFGDESEEKKLFNDLKGSVQLWYDTSGDDDIKNITARITSHDAVKNLCECISFCKVLNVVNDSPEMKNYLINNCMHIVKVSGRYVLTDDYNLDLHNQDGWTFAKERAGWIDPNTCGTDKQYMMRTYSVTANKFGDMVELYRDMMVDFNKTYNLGWYKDGEHFLFKYLENKNVKTLDKIGVRGNLGPNNALVED